MPLSLMDRFRRLMLVILGSGSLAGLALFGLQHATVTPLIGIAEAYEKSHDASGTTHDDPGWRPADGVERTTITAVGTMLTGVAFAALLFGVAALVEAPLSTRQGAFWGLAGFLCVALAPALGLPPVPPGAAVGDLHARQLWWAGTVIATSVGLWLLIGRRDRTWMLRGVGGLCLVAPHLIGAPAATGPGVVPPELLRRFALLSVASSAAFWLLLGAVGGFLSAARSDDRRHG